jgi:hypothetical protein
VTLRSRQAMLAAAVLVLTTVIGAVTGMLTSLVSAEWIGRYVLPLIAGLVLALVAVVIVGQIRPPRDRSRSEFSAKRVAAASLMDGLLRVLAVASDGRLITASYQETGIWSHWRDLEANARATDVAAIATSVHRIEAYYASADGTVWETEMPDDAAPHWAAVPGNPGVGRVVRLSVMRGWREGHREIFAVGEHGRLAHCWRWDHQNWDKWHQVDVGVPCRDVACSVPVDGLLECFVIGTDGSIRHRRYMQDNWREWGDTAGIGLPGSPVAIDALNGWPEQQEIFVVRADGGISHRNHWEGHDWREWRDLQAPALITDVAGSAVSKNRLEVIAVDRYGKLWQRSYVDLEGLWWGRWRMVPAEQNRERQLRTSEERS